MSSHPNIDDLFRKELDGMQHEYSEALWQKLDTQLQPERDAYHKKDKKRRAAWLVLPLALLLGGATWYFAGRPSSSSARPESIAANTEKNTGSSTNTTAAQPGTTEPATAGSSGASNGVQKTQPIVQPGNTAGNRQVNTPPTATAGSNNVTVKQNNSNSQQPVRTVTPTQQRIKSSKNNINIVVNRRKNNKPVADNDDNNDVTVSKTKSKKDAAVPDKRDEDVIAPVEEIKEAATVEDKPAVKPEETPVVKAEEPAQNKTDIKPEENKTAKAKPAAKKVADQTKLGVSAMAGANLSSPFRKPGAFGGVLLTKTIDGKHIFAGLKISSNKLDHQLVFAEKQNQPVVQTDAEIEKLTILQMPFGYEFRLNGKGKPATTFLQAGFEPAYIVGLRTIYYDDNGIPGGPRTPVMNSPIMSKAINKFNLSFIAGIRKQITPRIGITLNGGYSLIDITDKQYYNRTSSNNNLKYIQAGMLFRLNK